MNIGEKITALREFYDISMQELAEMTSTSPPDTRPDVTQWLHRASLTPYFRAFAAFFSSL